MLADPQSITVNAVAQSLPRTAFGENLGQFTKDDGAAKLSVAHAYGKRTRRTARFDFNKIVADPLVPTQNQKVGTSVYIVIDHPVTGFTNTEIKQISDGFLAWLTASSGANITKILGGES